MSPISPIRDTKSLMKILSRLSLFLVPLVLAVLLLRAQQQETRRAPAPNKQNTLDDYLHRAAIFDFDPRGGGMALYFATEMAGLK